MDKTQRLFAIMDSLRRHRHPVTAERLADEFSVSVRTLYRDVQTLIGLGAPIDGEAGVGYLLRPGFFLPPLMFSPEELEALVLGARWVEGRPDESLAKAAARAIGKIATATPEDLRDKIGATGLWPARAAARPTNEPLLGVVREAMRLEKTLHISYADENGSVTERPIWPIAIAYYEEKHIIAAWCVMRQALRNFRIDRVRSARPGDERFGKRRVALMKLWEDQWQADRQTRRGPSRPGGAVEQYK